MSKSVLNQRYCYKINSDYIRRNKGIIEIKDIRSAIKNRFIVGVGDSTGTRIIRDIIKSKYTEEYIKYIKYRIRKIKNNFDEENKFKFDIEDKIIDEFDENIKEHGISWLQDELLKACLQDRICNVVFNSDKDYDKYSTEGFILNKKKYTLLLGTPGGIKTNTVMFVEESIKEDLLKRIFNGADLSIATMPSKLMAYMALTFSSSTPVSYTPNILVVEDVETSFNDKVIHISFDDDKEQPTVKEIEDYNVINNACDGCGMIMPEFAKKWGEDLKLRYTPTSFVIRNSWIKGVLTKFDFREYAKSREDMKNKRVMDVWGKEWDLKDVDIIINRSMFKLSKHYKSLEEYLNNCNKNGYEFSVTKYVHDEIDNERMLNYQYIQCLNLSDDDIDNLLTKDISEIKEITGDNHIKSILFGRGKDLNDRNVWREDDVESRHISALMINKECINDSYIKDKIRRSIYKRINLLKTGKINVNGNYQIAIGEPIIQMESMFGLEPKGLLNSKEFYIEYWRELNSEKVAGFRSPMSCKQNARVMNVCNRDEVIKWYKGLKNVIVFNAWDTAMSAFNGEDFDGDLNFTSDNEILVEGIYDLPTIFCDGKSAAKIPNPTESDFIKAIHDGFGNKVGSVTNFGSSCYDKISLFKEGSEEYKELDYRIMCIQYLQQECIDSAKNGIPPRPIPSYWNNYEDKYVKINIDKETGEILDDETTLKKKLFNQSVLTEKKPYYFRYIYKESNKKYLDYINSMEINSLRNFRKSISELKADISNDEERKFIEYYDRHMPLSNNPCIVNKIAHKIENVFDGDSISIANGNFDYSIYMSTIDGEVKLPTNTNKKIIDLYNSYKKISKNKNSSLTNEPAKEDKTKDKNDLYDILRIDIRKVIQDEKVLCNTLIELSYKKNRISKSFVWSMVGDIILKNLLEKNNNTITYPIRDEEGSIVYGGVRFSLKNKLVEVAE